MPASTTLWERVTTALRSLTNGRPSKMESPTSADRAPPRDARADAADPRSWRFPWSPASRFAQRRAQQARMLGLVESLDARSSIAQERADQLIASVEWIAATLDRLSTEQRAQATQLGALAKPLETVGKQVHALSAVTQELPRALESQTQAVRTLGGTVQASAERHQRIEAVVQRCAESVEALRSSWSETVRLWRQADAAREQALKRLLDQQWRRMLVAAAAMTVLGMGLALAAVLGLRYVQF